MGKSGGPSGAERVNSEKARTQLKARKKSIEDSIIGKIPGVPNVAGGYSLNKQISDLDDKKSYAVAVPGTSFAAQGQAYTEAPGMKSDAEKASSQRMPLRRLGEAGDFKGVAVFLASDESSFMTGQALTICGGASMWS